jgi:hypothetical protein
MAIANFGSNSCRYLLITVTESSPQKVDYSWAGIPAAMQI